MHYLKSIIAIIVFFSFKASAQINMIPHFANPVLPLSQPNPGIWNDPSVIKTGREYWMYASSKNGAAHMFDGNVLPYLLKSTNGINWTLNSSTPLLLNSSDTSAWDYEGVETPDVVYFDSVYHMYYTAVPGSGQFAIGHATSNNGLNWIKDTIILTPTNIASDWMSYQVAEPGAVVFQNQLYLYFTGTGARLDTTYPGGKAVIGLITSTDGFNFTSPVKVLEQNSTYPASQGYYGYSTPSPLVMNNEIHLFFDVAREIPQWTQVAIHHAYSNNGVSGFVQDTAPIFKKDDFNWTKREIRAPDVLIDSNQIKMWFAGDNIFVDTSWGIGYASAIISSTLSGSPLFYKQKESEIIFPNPANENITISFNETTTFPKHIQLYSITGVLVREEEYYTHTQIDIRDLPNGIYFIKEKGEPLSKKLCFLKY